jgi:hypothetical protein
MVRVCNLYCMSISWPSLFKLSFPTFFIGSRLKIHVHHYPSAWITGLSIFSNVPVLHYLQVVLCIKIWTFSWIPYKTRTKYQLKWVKVPGTTPYWKACYHNLLKKVKGQRNGHAIKIMMKFENMKSGLFHS